MYHHTDLNENEARALAYVARNGGEMYGLSTLSTPLDMSREGVRQLCYRLSDNGYLTVNPEPEGTRITITRKGYQLIHPHLNSVDGNRSIADIPEPLDIHYVTVVCNIKNRQHLGEDWRAMWTEASSYKWVYELENDTYSSPVGVLDRTLFRFHRETVEIVVKRPGTGYNVSSVVQQVHERIEQAVEWVNRRTPAQIDIQGMDVVTTHAAILRDPMAQLVDKLEFDKRAFKIIDKETGRVRAEIEASRGIPELEFKGGDTAVEDVREAFESFYGTMAHEPEVIRAMVQRGRDLVESDSERSDTTPTVSGGEWREVNGENFKCF